MKDTNVVETTSSPTEREGIGGRREFDRQLEQRGGVWLGHLRLFDEPWRPVKTRGNQRSNPGGHRTGEDKGRHQRENSDRAKYESRGDGVSLSDDGSGASDGGAPEVTFDENTSDRVDRRTGEGGEDLGIELLDDEHNNRGTFQNKQINPATSDSRENAETHTRSGDGGSVVGDEPETSVEADMTVNVVPSSKFRRKMRSGGEGTKQRHARISGDSTEINLRRRKGSFSGRDYFNRKGSHRRDRHTGRMDTSGQSGGFLMCSLLAKPPPKDAGIPGTAGGEGFARAFAAGSAMPNLLDARIVTPSTTGWPDQWNPVALLRLFPNSSAKVPLRDSEHAFDALVKQLALSSGDLHETTTTDLKLTETEDTTVDATVEINTTLSEGEGEVPEGRATRAKAVPVR